MRASKAIDELSTVLLSYGTTDSETVDAAARDILRIGKRHGERPDSQITRLICRGCEAALIPGRNARFRISGGMLIITCKDCGRIGRSGPDF
jgi:RNase P subunit RPR2